MISGKQFELKKCDTLWQDREVRFDASSKELQLRAGERILIAWDQVEDSKGNNGDEGRFMVTNLRIIWQSKSKPRINLTIGLNCIVSITTRNLHTKLLNKCNALHIMCKSFGTRYEFIFTPQDQDETLANDPIHSKGVQITHFVSKVCKAYASSKLFRDLKLRSAIFTTREKQLKTLKSEQIYNKFQGVWNLSSDQGNLGTMHVTNFRIVWHANVNELFNLSLPYIQVSGIKVRESKFGPALVIESSESSGGYVLGFRIDPPQRLQAIYSELCNLYDVHVTNPCFGAEVYLNMDDNEHGANSTMMQNSHIYMEQYQERLSMSDYQEDGKEVNPDVIASYLDDNGQNLDKDDKPIYNNELGLAVERIKDGYTLESLWNVIPTD